MASGSRSGVLMTLLFGWVLSSIVMGDYLKYGILE